MFQGKTIVVTTTAMQETEERLFPESRHRSNRVHKKLVKRHGGEFKKVPCIFETAKCYYMHPVMYEQLKRETERRGMKNFSMGYDGTRP